MITYTELNEQNHRITELSNVLRYMIKERSICDTDSCCDLFYSYVDLVKEHIDLVDTDMYSDLLKSPDEHINNVAKNFMSGSVEIKKILKDYVRYWCPTKGKKALQIRDHSHFMEDTDQVFEIVLQRILDETEKLYPLVRTLTQ